jgi:hypothetical protein
MSQYPTGYPPPPPLPYATPSHIPRRPLNWIGTTALLTAIVGLILCWSVFGGVIFGVIAVIVGVNARGRVKRGEATNGPVATAGVVLGVLAVVVSLAVIGIWARLYQEVDAPGYVDCVTKASNQQGVAKCADELRQRVQDELGVTPPG